MKKQDYRFDMLGGLLLKRKGVTVDLRKELGNQLSSLFAFFLINHKVSLSKEKMIDTFWQDSENPANALKFAIFRLRNGLKKIDGLNDEFIMTSSNGYQMNEELNIVIDTEEFEKDILEAKHNNDINLFEKALKLYNGPYLEGIDASWAQIDRGYYSSLALDSYNTLANRYIDNKKIKEAIAICEKGLSFDDLDEQLITSYLRALVLNQNYNQAMTFYQHINKKYKEVLGISLESTGGSKFSAILSSGDKNATSVNKSIDNSYISGSLIVDGSSFNSIYMYVMRNKDRIDINAYLLKIKVKKDLLDKMDDLLKVLELLLRKSDVISKIHDNEFALLLNLRRENDEEIIEKRIKSRLSKISNNVDCIVYSWQKL